jgi:hypothetical protein
MLSSTEINNMTSANLPPVQILLAESNLAEIDRIKLTVGQEFQAGIKVSTSYSDLIAQITAEQPQLVLLGRIDRFNYFDICKECHAIRAELPIFLLSRQEIISDSFLQLAKTRGLADIIDPNSIALNKLFRTIARLPKQSTSISQSPEIRIVGETILTALREIVTVSNNYFGPLAQGNYWRKTHSQIVDEFPFLSNWSADHFSKISCNENILTQELVDRDIQSLRVWVQNFIKECDRIIVDFGSILTNSDISPLAKNLLTKP